MLRAEIAEFEGLTQRIAIDTSESRTAYLLIGRNGSHIRLSPSAYNLLKIFASGVSFEEASRRLQSQGTTVSPADLEAACLKVAREVLELERRADQSDVPRGFWLRLKLLPKSLVGRATAVLTPLFQPLAAGLIVAAAVAAAVAMHTFAPGSAFAASASTFWTGYLLFLASLIFHELGHATACARFGAPPYDIGFTFYLIYPAFYSDVTAAWRLGRWQRVAVDLGGAYFQLLAAAAFGGMYLATGRQAFAIAFSMISYSLAFSLNPIFRFDGYWVLADALGVTNLGSQPRQMVRRLIARIRRQQVEPMPWPLPVTLTLLIYTPITFAFWGYFLWRLLPSLYLQVMSYPGRIAALIAGMLAGKGLAGGQLQGFLVSTFLLLITLLMLWRLASPWLRPLRVVVRRAASFAVALPEPQGNRNA